MSNRVFEACREQTQTHRYKRWGRHSYDAIQFFGKTQIVFPDLPWGAEAFFL